jgi:hypothetical protein
MSAPTHADGGDPVIYPGAPVRVLRTSGAMEGGWIVYRCPHPSDTAYMAPELLADLAIYVGLPDDPDAPDGPGLEKRVRLGDLLSWQVPDPRTLADPCPGPETCPWKLGDTCPHHPKIEGEP